MVEKIPFAAPFAADVTQRWIRDLARYREPRHCRSIFEIAVTLMPFAALWALAWAAVHIGHWELSFLLAMPAAASTTFDGQWSVQIASSDSACSNAASVSIGISNGQVASNTASVSASGRVADAGIISVTLSSGIKRAVGFNDFSNQRPDRIVRHEAHCDMRPVRTTPDTRVCPHCRRRLLQRRRPHEEAEAHTLRNNRSR